MFQDSGTKRRRTDSSASGGEMADGGEEAVVSGAPGLRVAESPEHGMKVLKGLNSLKSEKVLCDVALIADGKK